ncbi:hypothetical protein CRG98_004262 [Punica granatum]|uniref:Reverse transcriptase/retrotransposon-derived protein RNase H-like domain-containing protein n=1 Tax=Punica granatum TaxID=22663 RepID=A0A2I0L3U7_PUNGR|nr:hypothetical protein CRG98_004262 [Punica granatum]
MSVVKNEVNELIPTRTVTGWRVCIDYRKLNDATRKDHFLLPFIDQMLEKLAGHDYYCFLDGYFDFAFVFYDSCLQVFNLLKEKLTSAPVIVAPDWELPFKLMCDASDYAVRAVLGQRRGKVFHVIYYASRTLNEAHRFFTQLKKSF